MTNVYVILVNGGLYEGNRVFDWDGVVEVFNEWSEGKDLVNEDDEVVELEDLMDGSVEIWNEEMVEMGDEYVEVGIVKLDIN